MSKPSQSEVASTIPPIIVALDVRGKREALALVERLKPAGLTHVKVGMSLFYEAGIELIELLESQGLKVFVDLKLHDIPQTVVRTVDVLIRGGARFLNVHTLGGFEMMQRAAEQAQKSADRLGIPTVNLIGVTILTSHHPKDFSQDLQSRLTLSEMVQHLARQAKDAGLQGVVCSAEEAARLREALGPDFLKVTPGIRPLAYGHADDQARVLTPLNASQEGATHLVVGRPIYEAEHPEEVLAAMLGELATTLV
jgi:orotidine-5'-phosphate decarboxylase